MVQGDAGGGLLKSGRTNEADKTLNRTAVLLLPTSLGSTPQQGSAMSLTSTEVLLLVLLAGWVGGVAGWSLCAWAVRRHQRLASREPPPHRPGITNAAPPATRAPAAGSKPTTAADVRGMQAPAAAKVATVPPGPVHAPPAAPAADLLLVDDSAVARAKLRRLFEAAGYRVHLASDGVEALALLEKGDYRMLITDLEMPNMDGIALINTCLARSQTARMPILAISGHENLRAKFNECHDIAGIHRKPWVDDLLLSHVATLVGTRSPRPGNGPPE